MDAEKIIQDLNRRFGAPLPEYYRRRIIFWYDEEREFEEQLDGIVPDGVKLARLTGGNTFAVKKLLCEEDVASNYLVYDPRSFTRDDDNWLINVQLYSEEFRADFISIWMDEMGLPATPVIRNQVKNYRRFFRAKHPGVRPHEHCKDVETFGSGIRKIYTLCNEANVAVSYINEETAFTLEFSRDDRNISPKSGEINGGITEAELLMLSLLKQSPSMTNADLAGASGKSERTISRLLATLKNKKLIQRIGSNKTGYWKVL